MELVVSVQNPSKSRSEALFDFGHGEKFEIYIETASELSNLADPWLALSLPLAMARGLNVRLVGSVSQSALNNHVNIQNELLAGHPNLKQVDVFAAEVIVELNPKALKKERRTGSFFSGGLDSTYTALNLPEHSELITVWGFDIPVEDTDHWGITSPLIVEQATAFGKSSVVVKTNLRDMSDKILDWGTGYNGTALAGIALALAPGFREIYIPGSYTNNYVVWGSFPTLDKSFSTDYLEIADHGLEVRIEKALYVLNSGAMKPIRVCWQNKSGLANCGECSKCIRTRFECYWLGNNVYPDGLWGVPSRVSVLKLNLSEGDYKFLREDLNWIFLTTQKRWLNYRVLFCLVFIKSQIRKGVVGKIPPRLKDFLKRN